MPSRISVNKQASRDSEISTATLNTERRSQGAANETTSDGPKPMINKKPVQKNPNGADSFRQTHQDEYVDRAKPTDLVNRVESHNNACPKLKDELDKKQSMSKVTAINLDRQRYYYATTQTATYYDPKCKWCVKQKLKDEKRRQEAKKKNRDKKARVTKSRKPHRRRMNKALRTIKFNERVCKRLPIDKWTSHDHKKVPTSSKMADKTMAPNVSDSSFSRPVIDGNENREDDPNESRKFDSKSDVASSNYPYTSEASVTTYNSFMSDNHEPMVSD